MRYRRVRASTNKAAGEGDSSAPAIAGEGDHPEGVVEGAQDSKLLRGESNDGVRRFIDIAAQLRRRNAHHCHAMFFEPSVTLFVMLRRFRRFSTALSSSSRAAPPPPRFAR